MSLARSSKFTLDADMRFFRIRDQFLAKLIYFFMRAFCYFCGLGQFFFQHDQVTPYKILVLHFYCITKVQRCNAYFVINTLSSQRINAVFKGCLCCFSMARFYRYVRHS